MRKIDEGKIYRIIDANLNRAKEGLRVCEDIARFIFDNKKLTGQYKSVRHKLSSVLDGLPFKKINAIKARDIGDDVGKKSIAVELERKNVKDIFLANSQRVKESVRVLEEFTKLLSGKTARGFKRLRYKIYALEKDIVKKF